MAYKIKLRATLSSDSCGLERHHSCNPLHMILWWPHHVASSMPKRQNNARFDRGLADKGDVLPVVEY